MLLIVLKSAADPAAGTDDGVLEEAAEDTEAKDEAEEDAAAAAEPSMSSRLGPLHEVLLPSPWRSLDDPDSATDEKEVGLYA